MTLARSSRDEQQRADGIRQWTHIVRGPTPRHVAARTVEPTKRSQGPASARLATAWETEELTPVAKEPTGRSRLVRIVVRLDRDGLLEDLPEHCTPISEMRGLVVDVHELDGRVNGVQADESPQVWGTNLHNPPKSGR